MPRTIKKAFNKGWESVGLDLVQRAVYMASQLESFSHLSSHSFG